jgi:protoheme IX farnesyltransferase
MVLRLADLRQLFKLPISGLSAVAAAQGYLAWSREIHGRMVVVSLGVFFLACCGAAWNEIQERGLDARMERTRNRPVAAGRISPASAAVLAGLAGAGGTALLMASTGGTVALSGVGVVLWYDLVYTPLKRVTAFALLPGALIGAATPALGWVAAGGPLRDGRLLALGFFWFLWQIPHCSLLVMSAGHDYEKAGFPSLIRLFAPPTLARMTYAWTAASAVSALFLPLFTVTSASWVGLVLGGAGFGLCVLSWRWLARGAFRSAFGAVNLFALTVMTVSMLDSLL